MDGRMIPRAAEAPAELTLPKDTSIALASLLNPEIMGRRLAACADPAYPAPRDLVTEYVRYRPDEACTVVYRSADTDGQRSRVRCYAHAMAEHRYARVAGRLAQRAWIPGPLGSTPCALDDLHTIVYTFPNDARLPGVGSFFAGRADDARMLRSDDAGASGDSQTAPVEVLRWKPESRCILRVRQDHAPGDLDEASDTVCLRFERPDRMGSQQSHIQRLTHTLRAHDEIAVPDSLGVFPDRGMTVQSWIEGDRLVNLLKSADSGTAAHKTGQILAHWHNLPTGGFPARRNIDARERAQTITAELVRFGLMTHGESIELVSEVHRLCQDTSPSVPVLLHGDFHPGQLLFGIHRAWVLDFHGACTGDCAVDVGNFIAQLLWLEARDRVHEGARVRTEFLSGYRTVRWAVVQERVAVWTGIGLLELALKNARRLRTSWADDAVHLLHLAESAIRG